MEMSHSMLSSKKRVQEARSLVLASALKSSDIKLKEFFKVWKAPRIELNLIISYRLIVPE